LNTTSHQEKSKKSTVKGIRLKPSAISYETFMRKTAIDLRVTGAGLRKTKPNARFLSLMGLESFAKPE
jgi:hypothetical protein